MDQVHQETVDTDTSVLDPQSSMKVVFLDIDGVLHSQSLAPQMGPVPLEDEQDIEGAAVVPTGELFHPPCMRQLQRLLSAAGPETLVVLSSSWRLEECWLEEAKSRLGEWGVEVFDSTPTAHQAGGAGPQRADEIVAWLRTCGGQVQSFVILDDLNLTTDALGPDRFVLVDGTVGLQEEDVDVALRILSGSTESVTCFVEKYDEWLAGLASSGKPWWWERACKNEKRKEKKQDKEKKKASKKDKKDKKEDKGDGV